MTSQSNTVERRIPAAGRWARLVTVIKPKAKTGHDLTGEWLQGGRLTDLAPGDVVLVCNDIGSRKRPCDEVDLYVVLPDDYADVTQHGLYYVGSESGRDRPGTRQRVGYCLLPARASRTRRAGERAP